MCVCSLLVGINVIDFVNVSIKVAMNSQQLGGHTLMNVRWAYDDPNPKAQLKVDGVAT